MKKVDGHNNYFHFLTLLIAVFSYSFLNAQSTGDPNLGKTLFNTNCAACHKLDGVMIGPALAGIEERRDRDWLHKWIRDSQALIASGDKDAVAIFEEWNRTPMNTFHQLSEQDIDNILAYTTSPPPDIVEEEVVEEVAVADPRPMKFIVMGLLVVVLVLLVTFVNQINKTLHAIAISNNISDEYIEKKKLFPIWNAYTKSQPLIFLFVIVLMFGGLYVVYGYLMQIGVDKGYEPIQPIHYSHKIHAGDNEIDCKFCHSNARVSKTAGVPSLMVCMNCHKSISEYKGVEDKVNGYTREFYTGEIKKLYEAVGWDETKQKYVNEEKPVHWVRIHNLPDFAYFNHSQHVTAGKIECQKCHGPVEEMEHMRQFQTLTMGWCIQCHKDTPVDDTNKYYDQIHAQLSEKYGVEKLTPAQLGGLECGKCHY